MTANEVAMNSALPRPHPARKPMIPFTPPAAPARALNTTMMTSPTTSVSLAPILEDTQPVISIATAVTSR